jgi:hypothetical protein
MDPTSCIAWAAHYQPEWDADPEAYVDAGLVAWGKTRRLGKLDLPGHPGAGFKAYIGVQHVDPGLGGWQLDAPEARFFISWFVGGRCLGLRVAPTMPQALALLCAAYAQAGGR